MMCSDIPRAESRVVVRIRVCVRIFGSVLWAFDLSGLLYRDVRPNVMVPTPATIHMAYSQRKMWPLLYIWPIGREWCGCYRTYDNSQGKL